MRPQVFKIRTMPSHSPFSYELFPQLSAISLVCCSLSIVWHYIVGLKNVTNSYLTDNAKRNISYWEFLSTHANTELVRKLVRLNL